MACMATVHRSFCLTAWQPEVPSRSRLHPYFEGGGLAGSVVNGRESWGKTTPGQPLGDGVRGCFCGNRCTQEWRAISTDTCTNLTTLLCMSQLTLCTSILGTIPHIHTLLLSGRYCPAECMWTPDPLRLLSWTGMHAPAQWPHAQDRAMQTHDGTQKLNEALSYAKVLSLAPSSGRFPARVTTSSWAFYHTWMLRFSSVCQTQRL